jgi:hypothetical protein
MLMHVEGLVQINGCNSIQSISRHLFYVLEVVLGTEDQESASHIFMCKGVTAKWLRWPC